MWPYLLIYNTLFLIGILFPAYLLKRRFFNHTPEDWVLFKDKLSERFPRFFRKRPVFYVMNAKGDIRPEYDEFKWIEWFRGSEDIRLVGHYYASYKDPDAPRVKRTVRIFSVFMGVDQNFSQIGPPVLFHTIVEGGLLDGQDFYHSTLNQALVCYRRLLHVQNALLRAEGVIGEREYIRFEIGDCHDSKDTSL